MKETIIKALIAKACNPHTPQNLLQEISSALVNEAKPEKRNEVRRLIDYTLARKGQEGICEISQVLMIFCGEITISENETNEILNKSVFYVEFLQSKNLH